MSDHIPFELQAEIMKTLPVKSLIRFRSVSKAWNSFIDSSDFIAAHTHTVRHTQPQHLLLRYENPCDYLGNYVSFVDDDTQKKCVLTLPPSHKKFHVRTIFGTSQGLLCLYGILKFGYGSTLTVYGVVLWNPSIRKCIDIPELDMMNKKPVFGFGVCPVINDPKILRLAHFRTSTNHAEIMVFTLSSGVWRSRYCDLTAKLVQISYQATIDRFIYWLASDRNDVDGGFRTLNMILSFDMIDDRFTNIDLPDSLVFRQGISPKLSKLRESLVVLTYSTNAERQECSVWMMDHGVRKSFTKLYTISTPFALLRETLGFNTSGKPILEMEDDQMVLEMEDDHQKMATVAVYEPISKHIDDLGVCGTETCFFMNLYNETLLLLDCKV